MIEILWLGVVVILFSLSGAMFGVDSRDGKDWTRPPV